MAYEKQAPEWSAAGIAPPESKRQTGWEVEDRPPAAWLNWFMNLTSESLKELQEKAAEASWVEEQLDGITVQDASLTQKGIVQLSSATSSTSESMAATPKAVNKALTDTRAYVDARTWQKFKLTNDDGRVQEIPTGTDLNTIVTPGFYNGSNLANAPGAFWYYIEVQVHSYTSDYVLQKATRLDAESGEVLFVRRRTGGTWWPWQELPSIGNNILKTGFGGQTTNSGNAYTVTIPNVTSLIAFMRVTLSINAANTGAATLNINGLGAKSLLKSNGQALAAGNLRQWGMYTFVYDGTAFILQGEGGEYGTAVAGDVRSTKTIGTNVGIVSGSLVTRATGATNVTPTMSTQTLLAGIYDGAITIAAASASKVVQSFSVPANSYKSFSYSSQPSIAQFLTSADTYYGASITLIKPSAFGVTGTSENTILFSSTTGPTYYQSYLGMSYWDGSGYVIYNQLTQLNVTITGYAYF